MNIIVTIIVLVVLLALLATLTYLYLKNKTLDDIRKDVYQLFLEAEHRYFKTGSGKQKMKYVIQKARSMLPNWAQAIITENMLEKVVQAWFDAIKDLLDDGKYNKSPNKTGGKTS